MRYVSKDQKVFVTFVANEELITGKFAECEVLMRINRCYLNRTLFNWCAKFPLGNIR